MTKTIKDLSEELCNLQELDLMELLNLCSEDIVNRFQDVIEVKYDKICRYFAEDEDDFEDSEETNPFYDRD